MTIAPRTSPCVARHNLHLQRHFYDIDFVHHFADQIRSGLGYGSDWRIGQQPRCFFFR